MVLLTNTVISPSAKQAIAALQAKLGGAPAAAAEDAPATAGKLEHIQYDTISYSGVTGANQKSFGLRAFPSYDLSKADVLVSIGAANHDPGVFEAPEQLDLARDPNPHLAFGFGTHFCLGAPLARLEALLAFEALTRSFRGLTLVDDTPRYRPNPVLRGLVRLDVAA